MPIRLESMTYQSKWEGHLNTHEVLGPCQDTSSINSLECASPANPSYAGLAYARARCLAPKTALLQLLKDRKGEEELCPAACWIQKPFGFRALAAVAAVKVMVSRALLTTVDVIWDKAAEQETPWRRDIFRRVLLKHQNSLRFWSRYIWHCRCLQFYTQECFLSHVLLSLQVPVMWIQTSIFMDTGKQAIME